MNGKTMSLRNPAVALACACVLLAGCLAAVALSPSNALAEPDAISDFKGTMKLAFLDGDNAHTYWAKGEGKIKSAKSSNKKVATVKVKNSDGFSQLIVTQKKTGTTKISFKLDGKKRTVKLVLAKYANPAKSFKIGSKQLVKKYNKHRYCLGPYDWETIVGKKITVKAKSGWKVAGIYVVHPVVDRDITKKVGNGYKFKTHESLAYVKFVNKKTKTVEYLHDFVL